MRAVVASAVVALLVWGAACTKANPAAPSAAPDPSAPFAAPVFALPDPPAAGETPAAADGDGEAFPTDYELPPDVLPLPGGDGWLYDLDAAFRFPLPDAWRVVPVPFELFRGGLAEGRYEYVLRPEVHAGALPVVRIMRLYDTAFPPDSLKPLDKAALHVLDHYFAGKYRKVLLPLTEGGGTAPHVAFDPVRRTMHLRFTVEPEVQQRWEAVIWFRARTTIMAAGVFSSEGVTYPRAPLDELFRGLQPAPE